MKEKSRITHKNMFPTTETESWTKAKMKVEVEAKVINVEGLEKRKGWDSFELLLATK